MAHGGQPIIRLRGRSRCGFPRRILVAAARGVAILVLALCFVGHAAAAPLDLLGVEAQQRRQAIESIPAQRLTPKAQQRIAEVVNRPSLYRRMPVTVVRTDPELYLFLIRHPEVVVNMWDLMGVTKVSVARTGDYTFDARDGAGTQCSVELLYGDRNVHVMYSEGHYEGPLLRRLIRGRCVLVLHSEYTQTNDGSIHVTNRLDMFVRFENVGAELLARTLHPLVGKSADHNFVESTKFLGQVSDAAATKLDRLQQFSRRLTKVDADVKNEFNTISAGVAQRMIERGLAQGSGDLAPGVAARNARWEPQRPPRP